MSQNENYQRVIDVCTLIINSSEETQLKKANAYFNRGITYFEKGIKNNEREQYAEAKANYTNAIADYTKAIALYPEKNDQAKAYIGRGIAYDELKQYEEAIADYTEAIALYPEKNDKANAYFNRGIAYHNLKQYEDAIANYTEAIALYPEKNDQAKAYNNRGRMYDKLKQYEKAIPDYKQAIDLFTDDDDQANVYFNRGRTYNQLKQYEEAIADFTEAIALYPEKNNQAKAYTNRGIAYHNLQQYEKAIADYTEAIKLATNKNTEANAYFNRGIVYHNLKQYKKAIADYTEAIELATDKKIKRIAYLGRAISYLKNDNKANILAKADFEYCLNYENAIDDLIIALQQGITNEEIDELRSFIDTLSEKNKPIFQIFESVAHIFNELKVKPDEELYLSHTTGFSVATKLLTGLRNSKSEFRMYHIAYANDPTEGTVLFEQLKLNIKEPSEKMLYVMVASFCGAEAKKELDNLPMWNMYGDNATGIALLFQGKHIADNQEGNATPLMSTIKFYGNDIADNQKENAMPLISSIEINNTDSQKSKENDSSEYVEPILYQVHYIGRNSDIDTKITEIGQALNKLKEITDPDIHNKALEMLDGVHYLIKSTKYQHENEYRLLYFANEDEIPERLKYEEGVHDNFSKPGIYVETNILTELCGIMTAPRVSETQVLEMQYLLQWGKKKLDKLEDNYIHKSKIPYRASRT